MRVFVYGTGTMGKGIALTSAQAGFEVLFCNDSFPDEVLPAINKIRSDVDKLQAKGKIALDEAEDLLKRIRPSTDIADCRQADFIVETIIEDVRVKHDVFRKIEAHAAPEAVLASNTTSCSITEIATGLLHPERVIGFHFFNPATTMKLVEIMPSLFTDDAVIEKAKGIALQLGKEPVVTKKEAPAGITSRILAGLLNEAVWVYHEGVAEADDIDKAIVLGCNHRIGPLALIDMIGVDIHLAKTRMLFEKTGDARYRPCYLLDQMVTAGFLGRKSGRGFYDYSGEKPVPMRFSR
ncbi:MAG: 3-hydroxyacyl-CoA dehydrogenase family protein [Betaproteobacteria bacterium]